MTISDNTILDRQTDVLISVVVPVYNCEDSLHLTLESLLQQTYTNIEIILVDDGSKDRSGVLCDRYAQSDNRIIAIHQINKGLAGARNTGIKNAQGEYLSFIDAGDYVELNLYESLLPYVYEGIDLIDFPFYTQDSQNERFPCVSKIEKNRVFDRKFIDREMMPCLLNIEDNPIINDPPICFVWKYLFKKSVIDDNCIWFDERRRKWEDKGFVVKYVDCSETIVFFDKPLYIYLCLENVEHLSSSYFRELALLIIEQREEYIKEYGDRYPFETDHYLKNSLFTIMDRIEEIVAHETEEDAKGLIQEIYSKPFVQRLAEWDFADNDKASPYQSLIKHNDVDGTYLLMQEQIKQKKKLHQQQNRKRMVARVKSKAKGYIRPLYQKIKAKANA